MSIKIDRTDIPTAATEHLKMPMEILIENERGLALLSGFDFRDNCWLQTTFWQRYQGSSDDGQVVLIRLDALIRVFASKRLRDVLLGGGFPVIWSAVEVAASMRLNANWGFNPHKFLWALQIRLQHERTMVQRFKRSECEAKPDEVKLLRLVA